MPVVEDKQEGARLVEEMLLEQEDVEHVASVFVLLDRRNANLVERGLLVEALQSWASSTSALSEKQVDDLVSEWAPDLLDQRSFHECIMRVVRAAVEAFETPALERSALAGGPSTVGAVLFGILEHERWGAVSMQDFRKAHRIKSVGDAITGREEARRKDGIIAGHQAEMQGVQETQMQQALEFNSAWSANMGTFERQAIEIEQSLRARHAEEFEAFRERLAALVTHSYKFSRDLLTLKRSIDVLAKQGRYDEADRVKRKADKLEMWERMKLDNDLKVALAKRELNQRRQQHQQLEALQRRIERGRAEHKEHWLVGAQRLMQSHRNMISDLKARQALEASRADVVVKLDFGTSRAQTAAARSRSHYSDAMPRVDTGRLPRRRGD